MAIFDNELMFSEAQAVTATSTSTNVIDCGQGLLTTGLNGAMDLFVLCVPVADFTGSGSLQIALEHCDTKAGTYEALTSLPDTAATALKRVLIPLPLEHKRFLRLKYTVTGSVADGKLTAGITRSVDLQQVYKAEDYGFDD